jgi:hypothetical protein
MSSEKKAGRGGPRNHGPEGGGDDRPRRRKAGRERRVHLQIALRRQLGEPPATPQAYARALEQWRQLAGAVWPGPLEAAIPPPDPASEAALDRADIEVHRDVPQSEG